jgi:hypothetical protein
MGATGPLFYLQKLVTLLILGLQHIMNLSAQMLVTLLDLSIHLYCIHTSDTTADAAGYYKNYLITCNIQY